MFYGINLSIIREESKGVLTVVFALIVISGCQTNLDAEPSVLVVTLDSVHRVWPPAPPNHSDHFTTLSYGYGNVIAMDSNYANKSLCYIKKKSVQSTFQCASVNDFTQRWELPKPTLLPTQFAVTSMAYDWASGAWYFVDKLQRCLYVCDGTLRRCRILRKGVEDPRALAVDPTPPASENQTAGFLFWSQKNPTPARLVRSDLAGGEVTGLLPKDCSGACTPKALTLDITNKLVFWVDEDTDITDTIQQSNYDGTGRITVYTIQEAYNKDIKVFSRFLSTLYLPGYRSVLTVTGNSTERTNMNGFPSIAAVFHESRQPKVCHPCAKDNGGCQQICVTVYQGLTPVAQCLCQHGYQLDSTKQGGCTRVSLESFMLVSRGAPPVVEVRGSPLSSSLADALAGGHRPTVADVDLQTEYIYFSDVYENQIIRQKLDGSVREEFIKDRLGECQGIAIDWMGGNLYFTDSHVADVSVARLAAPAQRRVLFRKSSYHPHSIVLDPQRGVMYWSGWARAANPYGVIEMANMDGSEQHTLVADDLEWPNGLLLDTDKQILYWCDTKLNKIESLELASRKRTTILGGSETATPVDQPYGLAMVDGELVWSEMSGQLRRLSSDGNVTLLESVTPPLFDIQLVTRSSRTGRNACSDNNGGCAELCLATPGGRSCACAAGRAPPPGEPTRCVADGMC